jgi:AcrR family transcriptional regulator
LTVRVNPNEHTKFSDELVTNGTAEIVAYQCSREVCAYSVLRMSSTGAPTADVLLRTVPRQDRSDRRIALILDTAATLFVEMSYDATSTKHIADRAGIAVGSIYHWFPDKATIAGTLAERYLTQLSVRYQDALAESDPGADPIVETFTSVLSEFGSSNPAFVALLVNAFTPGCPASPGEALRVGLRAIVGPFLEKRAAYTSADELEAISETVVAITHALLASFVRSNDKSRELQRQELAQVLKGYLSARLPRHDSARSSNPEPLRTSADLTIAR